MTSLDFQKKKNGFGFCSILWHSNINTSVRIWNDNSIYVIRNPSFEINFMFPNTILISLSDDYLNDYEYEAFQVTTINPW